MKGITVYSEQFSIQQERLHDMMASDSKGNPMLWFGKCLICQDFIVCGLDTKTETLSVMRDHMLEHQED